MSFLHIAEPGESQSKEFCRKRVVGIDLGTTHSLIASVVDGNPQCFVDEEGEALLPSVVQYQIGKPPLVGKKALQTVIHAPQDTIRSVKRLMGRNLADIPEETRQQYQLVTDEKIVRFQVAATHRLDQGRSTQMVTPIEVSAEILRNLRKRAEATLGGPIEGAVITVPAYFDEAQRQATKDAGRLAGLPVLRLLNEPTAAALAYGLDQKSEGIFAVYDLGGGTFDISILELREGVFGVLSTAGDTALGGDDMDDAIANWLVSVHPRSQEFQAALRQDKSLAVEFSVACRKIKHELTQKQEAVFGGVGSFLEEIPLTEEKFSRLIEDLLLRTSACCKRALIDAHLSAKDLDGVILVGGATRVPAVRRHVAQLFGIAPLTNVDPDQVVAVGAAIQSEIIANRRDDVVLLDVTPLSLGLGLMGGVVEKIIPRNSRIPTAARQIFTTYAEGQTGFDLHIVQGERDRVEDCRSLARFQLTGIPKMAAGMARLEVLFLVDENGLLQVTATELTSLKEAHIQVQPSYGLTEEQVEQMLLESYEHAEEDVAYRSLMEQKVEAQGVLSVLQGALQKDSLLLSLQEKVQIDEAISNLHQALAGTDSKNIKSCLELLEESCRGFMERRMNRGLQKVMTGHTVLEIEQQLHSEKIREKS